MVARSVLVVVGRGQRVGGPVLQGFADWCTGTLAKQPDELRAAVGAQHLVGDLATHRRRHTEEAEQRGVAAGHRDVMNLAHRADAASRAAGEALLAPERRFVDRHILRVRRHPRRRGPPAARELSRQRWIKLQAGYGKSRRQCQQHLLDVPNRGLASCIVNCQLDTRGLAAQPPHCLAGADDGRIEPSVQRSDEAARAARQPHRRRLACKSVCAKRLRLRRALDEHVAVFELAKAPEPQFGNQPVELGLQCWPEPARPEVEAIER
jgi:hypothetical protein